MTSLIGKVLEFVLLTDLAEGDLSVVKYCGYISDGLNPMISFVASIVEPTDTDAEEGPHWSTALDR